MWVQDLEESATLCGVTEKLLSKLPHALRCFRIVPAVAASVGVLSVPLSNVVGCPDVELYVRVAFVKPGGANSCVPLCRRLRNLGCSEVHNKAHEVTLNQRKLSLSGPTSKQG